MEALIVILATIVIVALLLTLALQTRRHRSGNAGLIDMQERAKTLQDKWLGAISSLDHSNVSTTVLRDALEVLSIDGIALYSMPKHSDTYKLYGAEGSIMKIGLDATIPSKKLFTVFNKEDVVICKASDMPTFSVCEQIFANSNACALILRLDNGDDFSGLAFIARKSNGTFEAEFVEEIQNYLKWVSAAVANSLAYEDLLDAYLNAIFSLSKAVEKKDPYAQGHAENVARISAELAVYMGLSETDVERIYLGGLVHDIGKISVPEAILNKPDDLTDSEYDVVKNHPFSGLDIINQIEDIVEVTDIIMYHHERFDGKGYPRGLKGEFIPRDARIVAIVDAFDAMISDRSYRSGLPFKEALEAIEANAGTQFDPKIARVFVQMMLQKIQLNKNSAGADDEDSPSITEIA